MQEQIQEPLVEQREPIQHWEKRIAEALEDISFILKWILAFYIIVIIANAKAVLVKLPR